MAELIISVRKLTDEDLLREACETTFLGKSNASLLSLYKAEHSPVRTQLFWITFKNLKLFISTHLIRHHVGSVPFQLTCRDDRKGGNPGLIARCDELKMHLVQANYNAAIGNHKASKDEIIYTMEGLNWIEENTDRNTPVNLSLLVNAQSLIDMAKLRLCTQAHVETRLVFNKLKEEISKIDPDLAYMMVPKCVYRGGLCGEPKCCGYNNTPVFETELREYVSHFNKAQRGMFICPKK